LYFVHGGILEQIRDAQVMSLVERIGEHYRTNIANRFIRPALLQLQLDKTTWNLIETLTEKFEQFRYQGFQIDELYRQVTAASRFAAATRREVAPNLRYRLSGGASGPEKVLRDMAVNAFSPNLSLMADLLGELYDRLKTLDVAASKDKRPIYQQMPELYGLEEVITSARG
jgi:hypothetical protein